MTAPLPFSVITPRFWRRVTADFRTFPSCAPILFISFGFFTYFSLFLSHSILFFSSHTPTLAVLHPFFVFGLLLGRWLPEIIGGPVLQAESEQTNIQQGHNVCDSFLLTFSSATPHFPKTPTSGPPAYRGDRKGIFRIRKRVSVKSRCR